ncbi:hypothetical protein AVEN_106467-1 [Araneus ventricosus]|uniref:Gustatory receptor n=1 Tax=Araneus ventricosus TaxID=182803 RepID=A0A4Y2AT18_ARAVE|nr:hypothetical protein AVEN_106467-1 [Araneus ventricosus]
MSNKEQLFIKKSGFNYTYNNEYGLLWDVMNVFAIDARSEDNNTCKSKCFKTALEVIFPALLYFTQVYITCISVLAHRAGEMNFAIATAFTCSSLFAIPLWHSVKTKESCILELITQYQRMNAFQGKSIPNQNIAINVAILLSIFISVSSAIVCAIWMSTDEKMKLCYNFFIAFEENYISIAIRLCMLLLIFTSQYIFPSLVAVMCGVLYHKYSCLLCIFHKELNDLRKNCLNRNIVRLKTKQHALLFQVAHKLEDVTSLICFLFLCSRMVIMYFTLATVMLEGGSIALATIWESMPVITAVPLSLVGVTLCASQISAQSQKTYFALAILQDELIDQNDTDSETFHYLKIMLNKSFPPVAPCSVVELTPKFNITVFGSLFTYGLLILNLGNK